MELPTYTTQPHTTSHHSSPHHSTIPHTDPHHSTVGSWVELQYYSTENFYLSSQRFEKSFEVFSRMVFNLCYRYFYHFWDTFHIKSKCFEFENVLLLFLGNSWTNYNENHVSIIKFSQSCYQKTAILKMFLNYHDMTETWNFVVKLHICFSWKIVFISSINLRCKFLLKNII